MIFAEKHGQRFAEELGLVGQQEWKLDMQGVKNGFGVDSSVDRLTYRELQERRALIQKRMRDQTAR